MGHTSLDYACHATALLILSLVTCVGQEVNTPSPGDRAAWVQALPIEPTKRRLLDSAVRRYDYPQAEALLAAEAEQSPKSQILLLSLANILFLEGKQLNVVVALKKAELLGPLDEQRQFLLAMSYISLERENLAIPQLEQLCLSNPRKALYPYWLSRLMYRKMNLKRALLYAQQAVGTDAEFAKGYDQLGLCYAGLGRTEDAITAYKNAIRLSDQQSLHWPWPSMNLGTLYLRSEQLVEAENVLRKSISVERSFPVSHFRLGQVLEKEGRGNEAAQELIEASRLDPTYPEPHYVLARVFRRQNDTKSAEQQLILFQQLRDADKRNRVRRPD
jgi:tetratricopeptide (TPR) repeat protein